MAVKAKPKHTTAKIPNKRQLTRMQALAEKGHSCRDIAKLTGYTHPTIKKYLTHIEQAEAPLTQINERLGTMLKDNLTLSNLNLHNLLIELMQRDVSTMSASDLNKSIEVQSKVASFMHNNSRLHDGKSTVNTSHRIVLNDAHKLRAQRATSSGSAPNEQESVGETPVAIRDNEGKNEAQVVDVTDDNVDE